MPQTCSNCLNAYNSPHDSQVHCYNREWWQQFHPNTRTTVTRNESCGTWQRRKENQEPLAFNKPVQLELFNNI